MPIEFDYDRDEPTVTPDTVSEGIHNFQIPSQEFKEYDGPAGKYVRFKVVCVDQGPDRGKKAEVMLSFAKDAKWKMDQFLDGIGAPKRGKGTIDSFVGRFFKGKVKYETYNGRKNGNVTNFLPLDQATAALNKVPAPTSAPANQFTGNNPPTQLDDNLQPVADPSESTPPAVSQAAGQKKAPF